MKLWRKLRERLSEFKKRKADDAEEYRRLRERYKAVFGSAEGEEVLLDICRKGCVFDTTFVAGDPYHTVLNEGSRRAAMDIVDILELDFEQLNKKHETDESRPGWW